MRQVLLLRRWYAGVGFLVRVRRNSASVAATDGSLRRAVFLGTALGMVFGWAEDLVVRRAVLHGMALGVVLGSAEDLVVRARKNV